MLLIYGNEEAFSSVGAETFVEIVRATVPSTRGCSSRVSSSAPMAWPTR